MYDTVKYFIYADTLFCKIQTVWFHEFLFLQNSFQTQPGVSVNKYFSDVFNVGGFYFVN